MKKRSRHLKLIVGVFVITIFLFATVYRNVAIKESCNNSKSCSSDINSVVTPVHEKPGKPEGLKLTTTKPSPPKKRKSIAACEEYGQPYEDHRFRNTHYNPSKETQQVQTENCITHISHLLATLKYVDTTQSKKPRARKLLWTPAEISDDKILSNTKQIMETIDKKKLENLKEKMKFFVSKGKVSYAPNIEKMINDCFSYLKSSFKKLKFLTPEFPHLSALAVNTSNNRYEFVCGGSLISSKFVITAAHCVKPSKPDFVRMGITFIPDFVEEFDPNFDYKVKEIIPYPNDNKIHDIALIGLIEHVTFSKIVKPACLHTQEQLPNNLIITGWGMRRLNEGRSKYLLKKEVQLVSAEDCLKNYADNAGTSQICVISQTGSSCMGDSGSPLQIEQEAKFVIVGVTSNGKNCATATPSRYINIFYYLEWIESVVWPDNFG